MTRIKETLIVEIGEVAVKVVNDGIKKFEEQENGMSNLRDYLKEQIEKGETEGWLPYANFESSIDWVVVDKYICGNCKKPFYWSKTAGTPEFSHDPETGEDYPICPECDKKDKEQFRKEMMGGSLLDIMGDAFNPNSDE